MRSERCCIVFMTSIALAADPFSSFENGARAID